MTKHWTVCFWKDMLPFAAQTICCMWSACPGPDAPFLDKVVALQT